MSDPDYWLLSFLTVWAILYSLITWWVVRAMERLSWRIERLGQAQDSLREQHEEILGAYNRLLLHREQEWLGD